MMTTGFISSLNLWNAPRTGASRLQTELADATREIATGRHADVGATLGGGVAQSFGLRRQSAVLAALTQSNAAASLRLDASQSALTAIQADADAMLKELTGLPADQRAAAIAASAATRLSALTASLNTGIGGQAVFGGTDTGAAPLTAYEGSPASAARTAVQTALAAAFPGGTANATAGQMTAFLDGLHASLFSETGWSQWSGASNRTITSQISLTETATTSASANAAPLRDLAMAYVIGSGIGLSGFPADAQAVATARMSDLLGSASRGLVTMQADLGRAQSRITDANARMQKQTALLSARINALESVDPAEAKSRVDALTTQIQMSYGLTAQLRSLSLINFVS
ncbi:flagellar hook-associated protein 3 FlgL [Methylorubrum rhodinum]|uniref:Flagellin n=1 Tax=Methylorubrum rhodinum TaxID=29428 RepID=A0A840ZSB1_9HYPH|nr:flagellar hook-associated family protein [Methylorubrum rhodinum]MBB5759573.1 flagellar hook-associated protein 3 FlgL [Methylorubrum rhodinum]